MSLLHNNHIKHRILICRVLQTGHMPRQPRAQHNLLQRQIPHGEGCSIWNTWTQCIDDGANIIANCKHNSVCYKSAHRGRADRSYPRNTSSIICTNHCPHIHAWGGIRRWHTTCLFTSRREGVDDLYNRIYMCNPSNVCYRTALNASGVRCSIWSTWTQCIDDGVNIILICNHNSTCYRTASNGRANCSDPRTHQQ